jgi:hypothetical protein
MRKQLFLLVVIIFGAVYFPSLKNNGVSACDKNCKAAFFAIKKNAAKQIVADEDQSSYDRYKACPFPVTL